MGALDDLDNRRLPAADRDVAVLQAQRLAQPQTGLRQQLEEEAVAQRAPPLAGLRAARDAPRMRSICCGERIGGRRGGARRRRTSGARRSLRLATCSMNGR